MKLSIGKKEEIVRERLNKAIHWMLNSGIQNHSHENQQISGGFNCWYDIERKEYPFIYAEITGYAIETLLNLYYREKKDKYLERAVNAADWLITNMQYDGEDPTARGGFFWKRFPDGSLSRSLFAFDTGMCIIALVDLFYATKKHEYLDSSTSAAKWLVDVMQNENGSFKALYNLEDKSFKDAEEKWSRVPGSYHAKISIGLLKLNYVMEDEKLKKSVNNLCNWVLKLQRPDGKIKNNENSEDIYIHAHCYATEGLLYSSQELRNNEFKKAGLEGARWLVNAQNSKGGISRWHLNGNEFSSDENTEALAQTIRIWLIINTLYPQYDFFHPFIEKALDHLLDLQCLDSEDNKTKGGFYYAMMDNKIVPHINSCATFFSIQALQMYLDWKGGDFSSSTFLQWLI